MLKHLTLASLRGSIHCADMRSLQDASSRKVWENPLLAFVPLALLQFISTTPVWLAIIFRVFKTPVPARLTTRPATC